MKTKEKLEACKLRIEKRLSLCEIAGILGVSKSSVSLWVRDLPLSQQEIKKRKMVGWTIAGKTRAKKARAIRIQYQLNGRDMAEKHKNNPLFMGGCMMHWAEGAKTRNCANICNTDSYFLRLWMRFMTQFFKVEQTDFRIHIKCYLNNNKTQREIEEYWIQQLNISKSCFTKTTIIKKHPMSSGVKKNRHPYGTVSLKVNSTQIVQQIWGAIKFLANIYDEKLWID